MDYSVKQRFDVRHNCSPFGVLLRWLNPLNNFETWLFSGRTTRVLEIGASVTFASSDERTDEVLLKQGTPAITLRAMNFSRAQAAGLASLFTSPKVVAYIEGKPVSVQVTAGSFTSVDELIKRQTLTFEILLPKTNSLTQ